MYLTVLSFKYGGVLKMATDCFDGTYKYRRPKYPVGSFSFLMKLLDFLAINENIQIFKKLLLVY